MESLEARPRHRGRPQLESPIGPSITHQDARARTRGAPHRPPGPAHAPPVSVLASAPRVGHHPSATRDTPGTPRLARSAPETRQQTSKDSPGESTPARRYQNGSPGTRQTRRRVAPRRWNTPSAGPATAVSPAAKNSPCPTETGPYTPSVSVGHLLNMEKLP